MHRRFWSILVVAALIAAVGVVSAPGPRASATNELPECLEEVATIVGAGTINGTSGDDVIVGSDGPDLIRGNGGHDLICGGDGNDRIFGGSGDDEIVGQEGEDDISGDAGWDALAGDEFLPFSLVAEVACDDVIKGGSGNDLIEDDCGYNQAYGGGGSDIIDVTGLADGGSGDDFGCFCPDDDDFEAAHFFSGVNATESCKGCHDAVAKGGSGEDDVHVFGGVADGGSGNDDVEGNFEDDEVRGGAGNDNVVNDSGDPMTLNGGSGFDVCSSADAADVIISCET